MTSLRNVTELFVRVGAHDAAAQLFGALHDRDLKGSYGDEARRLADARTSLERALGAGLLQRSMAHDATTGTQVLKAERRPEHCARAGPGRRRPDGDPYLFTHNRPGWFPDRLASAWSARPFFGLAQSLQGLWAAW